MDALQQRLFAAYKAKQAEKLRRDAEVWAARGRDDFAAMLRRHADELANEATS